MDILELTMKNNNIIHYKYLTNDSEILLLIDTFLVPIEPPILSKFIPIDITSRIKYNNDETISIIFNKIA